MKLHPLILIKLLIIITVACNFVPAINTLSYSKSWSFERGDALKIEINPELTTFKTGKNYTFSVVLSPLTFASNQDKFSNISVQLRYNVANTIIYSSVLGKYEFDSLSTSITKHISLAVPSENKLNITKQTSGSLEYKLDYNIGFATGNVTYESTEWEIISIVNLVITSNQNNLFLIAFIVIIVLVVMALAFRYRKKNEENSNSEMMAKIPEKDQDNK